MRVADHHGQRGRQVEDVVIRPPVIGRTHPHSIPVVVELDYQGATGGLGEFVGMVVGVGAEGEPSLQARETEGRTSFERALLGILVRRA
jgi:hypothetical protein